MKVVILAGGLGSRISEETEVKPKPMIEVGGKPILWHIMKTYSHYGLNEFIICCGYKGYQIKEYFANYYLHSSDVTFDLLKNSFEIHKNSLEPWKVTLVDTGDETQTGGRLKRIRDYLSSEEDFCMTYGDGLADIDLNEEINFHRTHKKLATMLLVRPPGRFGAVKLNNSSVVEFSEKPEGENSWINGGFFILSPKVIDLIESDSTLWEEGPLQKLTSMGQIEGYRHGGFWKPMDTLRDKRVLEELWDSGVRPWKIW